MYEREKLKLIIESAAHLVAVMVDKNLGVKRGRYSEEVQDSFEILYEQLEKNGFLKNYMLPDGSVGIYDNELEDSRYAKRRSKPNIFTTKRSTNRQE